MYKKSKYHNKVTQYDGKVFDSKKEATRYVMLQLLLKGGVIRDLQCQVKFELIPKQEGERACYYMADFTYYEQDKDGKWEYIVEDCKGARTEVYKIKRKLMLYVHNIRIRET